jgi:hypothetical protein
VAPNAAVEAGEWEYHKSWDELPRRSMKFATGVSATESAALDDSKSGAESPSNINQ